MGNGEMGNGEMGNGNRHLNCAVLHVKQKQLMSLSVWYYHYCLELGKFKK